MHSVQFMDPKPFTGKRVVIVGAGNTAIDIAQDLCNANAKEVTMVQRSSTCIVSRDTVVKLQGRAFAADVPIEWCDFKAFAVPLGYLRQEMIKRQPMQWALEKDLHAKGSAGLSNPAKRRELKIKQYQKEKELKGRLEVCTESLSVSTLIQEDSAGRAKTARACARRFIIRI